MKSKLIVRLKKWIRSGHTKIELAHALGYKSASTINNWLSRGSIPDYMTDKVEEVIK